MKENIAKHIAKGGKILYCYKDQIGSPAGPPARWETLGSSDEFEALDQKNGKVEGVSVIYKIVPQKRILQASVV